uniref:Putative exonuclease n=1 Tax=viral metagenome TaxID=1070528 RepID=A0A6M3J3F0_9ZZZZ
MEIIDTIVQGSDEWFAARLGSIGGSSIADVVAGGQGKMRKNLMYRLAGEILSGVKYEGYKNEHMDRGLEQEPDARSFYELISGNTVRQVGLVKESDYIHFSPDGLVDPDGITEIKCTIPSVHIETILQNEIPAAYRKQCQWGLYICQRQWVDFVSYSPLITDKPILIIRRVRDEKLIQELKEGAEKFLMEMAKIIRQVKEVS